MKHNPIPRSHLFLIELIVVILFFGISAAVLLQVFAGSRNLADDSMVLNRGIMAAQNVAEEQKTLPLNQLQSLETCYSQDWQVVTAKEAVYKVVSTVNLEQRPAGVMAVWSHQVLEDANKIYQLEAKKYYPNRGGALNE